MKNDLIPYDDFMRVKALHNQYDLFNKIIFDNRLPFCDIQINNSKRAMGLFYPLIDGDGNKRYLIKISRHYDNQGITLIHEMVHALQWLEDKPVNHGKYFKMWKETILNNLGLDI